MNNSKFFVINKKLVECRFGLKSLKILAESAYDIDKDSTLLWFIGSGNSHGELPESLKQDFKNFFNSIYIPSKQELEELYIRGLGELNIPLNVLNEMTPQEIQMAYQGYLRRQELQANLYKMAMMQALSKDEHLIELISSNHLVGNQQERGRIFSELKEEDQHE